MKLSQAILLIAVLCICMAQCHPAKSASERNTAQLFQGQWELHMLQGNPVVKTAQFRPYLVFMPGENGQLSGSLGCNHLGGTFTLDEGSGIRISALMTTKMACPEQGLEYQFSRVLELVDTWSLAGESLVLLKGGKPAATFIQAEDH